ncbi:MAG: hypothetical protein ABIW82_13715 [Dokdonella sp.]
MKTRTLVVATLIAIACSAGVAQAVTLNPKGLGQVLIFPYYTVNKGQDTLLSVINTSTVGSAFKLRFNEGMNGRDVLEFNVLLSPHDVWTARISQLANDGGAAVFTSDHSCTYPPIPPGGQPFRASAYAGGSAFPADGGPTTVARTREGSIEIIELGAIIPGSDLDDTTTHVQHGNPNTGVPACDAALIGNGANAYVDVPLGGLFGSASIVNVGEGTFFSYSADAIAGFTDVHLFSGSSGFVPTLQQANTADSASAVGAVAHVASNNGNMLALDYANGIDAVSAVFMADEIYNEYLVAAGLGANTDWVVTFPTKAFYTDPFYNPITANPPFHELFHAPGVSNIEVGASTFDQEEGYVFSSGGEVDPPIPPPPLPLPYVVNVISFVNGVALPGNLISGVFGSTLTSSLAPYGDAGWVVLDLASGDSASHSLRPAANGYVLHGLPVTGFMVYNIINANAAPGKLANYGGTYVHRASLSCIRSVTDMNVCP